MLVSCTLWLGRSFINLIGEFQGSMRVTERFHTRYIDAATKRFGDTTKPRFDKVDDIYRAELGDRKCHDPEHGIHAG